MLGVAAECAGVEEGAVRVEGRHHDVRHKVTEVSLPGPHAGELPVQHHAELPQLLAHLGVHHPGVLGENGLELGVGLVLPGHVHSLDVHLQRLLSEVKCNLGKLTEVCTAFQDEFAVDLVLLVDMVMASEDQIYALHVLCQADVIRCPHVGQRDHNLTPVAPQFGHELVSGVDIVLEVDLVCVDGGQGVEPLPLDKPEDAQPPPLPLDHVTPEPLCQLTPRLPVHHIGHQPRERGPGHQVIEGLQAKIWDDFYEST